ncbi:hypothetical protein ABE67_19160 [Cytobacillus firmus]|uniref:hypothetical protein n=1 Tax=Cytobacillus firmus TaxID=1399 RepID=UPI0018CDBB63|nr:hypothetical protein [Cytobacillus firmus]MBG9451342.1 hypothetical protein [Cytobacillus firmus]
MLSCENRKGLTVSSGPIHIPALNQGNLVNDRIVITIKNHSNQSFQASVIVEECRPDLTTTIMLPSASNIKERTLASFPKETIPGNKCRVYNVAIPVNSFPFIKVSSKGDYEAIEGRPAGGKLEISVVAGTGRTLTDIPAHGLRIADAATFVPYGSWFIE